MPSDVLITPASSKIDFTDGSNATKRLNISGTAFSFNSNLNVLSSTSLSSAFKAEGVNGTLFEVTDDLSNSLISVNTIGGLPVFEVFANNSIIGGQYGANDFVISGNKIGLGYANPVNKLSVSGSVSIGSSYNVAAPSNGLIVQGDVGIGVTSFAYSNANRANLEMYGSGESLLALRNSTGNSYIQKSGADFYINNITNGFISISNNGSERWRITSTGIFESNNAQTIRTSTGNLTLATNAGNGHVILSPHGTGNVGVGTATPSQKLEVQGNIKLGADGAGSYIYYVKDNEGTIINTSRSDVSQQGLFRSDGWGNFTVDKSIGIGYSLGSSFASSAIGNGNLYVLNSIGINTTSPLTKLDVRSGSITSGTATSTAGSTIIAGYYTAGALTVLGTEYASGGPVLGYAVTPSTSATGAFLSSTGIAIGRSAYTQDGGTHRWYIGASQTVAVGGAVTASEVMRININGNVGIGTTNPSHPLTVSRPTQAAAYQINLNNDTGIANGNYTGIRFSQGDGGTTELGSIRLSYFTTGSTALSFGVRNASQALYIGTDGNVGVNTTSPSYKLDVNGTTRFGGIVYNEAVQIDDFNYFNLQPYIESETLSTILSFGGTAPTFVTLTNTASPFSKVLSVSAYGEALMSDYIPVQAGETIYGEIWTYRATGAAGTAGVIYCGVQRYDKDKKMIDGNGGLNTSPSGYFIASNQTIPSNSTWTKYSGTLVLPTSHTVYNTSDGGPVRYIRPYIIYNYTAGTILTYIGGWKIRKVQLTRDLGPVSINGNVGIGSDISSYSRLLLSTTSTTPTLNSTNPVDVSLIISNSDVAYGTMFATYGDGKGALQQRRTNAATYYDFSLQPHGGNVGVGTLSTTQKLSVTDTLSITNTAGIQYLLMGNQDSSGANNPAIIQSANGAFSFGGGTSWSGSGGTFTSTMFLSDAGNVGIGTVTPSAKLSTGATSGMKLLVYDNSSTGVYTGLGQDLAAGNSTDLFAHSVSNLGFITFGKIGTNGSTYTEWGRFNPSGNLGIGTTNPATLLHVDTAGADARIRVSAGSNTVQGGMIANTNGLVYAGSITNHGFSLRTNDTDRVRIQTDGNVGIGTVTPASILHLNGTAPTILTLSSTSYPSTYLSTFGVDSGARAFLIFGNNAENQVRAGRTTTGGYLDFYTNNTVGQTTLASDGNFVMRLTAGGNIGVGATTASNKLTVSGPVSIGSNYNTAAPTNGLIVEGSVGIGVTSPNIKLHVVSTSEAARFEGSATWGTAIQITSTATGGRNYQIQSSANAAGEGGGKLLFVDKTSSATRMTIDSVGNIGIGTLSPSGQLHINSTTSGATLLRTDGTNGTLFSVVDDLSDSLMSVNNSAGLPVLEVFADDRVVAGQYGANDFVLVNNKLGLGTNNPQYELDIVGPGTNAAVNIITRIRSSASSDTFNTGSVIAFTNTTTNVNAYSYIGSRIDLGGAGDNAQALIFATNATNTLPTEKMRIKSDGNVGIGATNPATLLQIGTGTPSSATGGIQFGDDTGTRLYRSAPGIITCSGTIAATFSGNLTGNVTGNATNVTGTVAIANGGSGQTSAQAAMNAFAGAVTSGSYLRGNGTNVVMSAIQAADVPTLNQNTTGSSGSCTGNAATATNASQLGGAVAAKYVRTDTDGTAGDMFSLVTVTKSLTVTTSWIDTGISAGSDLFSGAYILTLNVDNYAVSGGHYNETYTGIMYWYAGVTNSADYDEIPLHKSGHAPNGRYINLRTLRGVSGVLKLQIISSVVTSGASNYIFKFRRMI